MRSATSTRRGPFTRSACALLLGLCAAACSPASPPVSARGSAPVVESTTPLTADECAGESAVDVTHHAIDLSFSDDPRTLSGHGEIRLVARRETAVLVLDARGLDVGEVSTEAGPLPFRHAEDRLCARLPRPLSIGAESRVSVKWKVPVDREAPHLQGDVVWAGYTSSAWMPTRQDPAQRATLTLRITAPGAWKVAAVGRPTGTVTESGGRVTRSFTLDRPSPPFLYAFAAGRFAEAELNTDGIRLRALGPEGADLAGALAITAPMLRFLQSHTGAAFPAAEYTQVFVPGDAAQEAAGLSLLSADALDEVKKDPTEDWIFSHELSHQWFAWLLPCADFADFWLNEGFATFLVAAVKEERWGRQAYDREVGLWRKRSAKVHAEGHDAPLSLSGPGAPPRPPVKEADLQPRGVTYSRGALVLHKLREELGDTLFWRGVQRYVKDRAGRGARSEDLRASLEAASGRDLRAFFERWVYTAAPDL